MTMKPDQQLLIARYASGDQSPELIHALTQSVSENNECLSELIDECAIDHILHEQYRPGLNPNVVMSAIAEQSKSKKLEQNVMSTIKRRQAIRLKTKRRKQRLAILFTLSSAALIVIAVLWGTLSQSTPINPAGNQSLGLVHFVNDVQWQQSDSSAPRDGARFKPGELLLKSGVIELKFDNSAVLVLEGPLNLDVQSDMNVVLKYGRLTTNVPSAAKGFTVETNHLAVIDQGTEIGVDLSAGGQAHIQVFTGAADIAIKSSRLNSRNSPLQRISPGEARIFDPNSATLSVTKFEEFRYIRPGQLGPLKISLADIIAGGNGRGSGTMIGINIKAGKFQENELKLSKRSVIEAGKPGFIDRYFFPESGSKPTVVDSLLNQYQFNNKNKLNYHDLILNGGILIFPPQENVTKPTWAPTLIGGVDYSVHGHDLIGMHASCGLTLDLHAIQKAYSRYPSRFTAVLANTYNGSKQYAPGEMTILVDGKVLKQVTAPYISQAPISLDIPLSANDRFLTLVSTDGGSSTQGKWTTLGDPRLLLTPQ